MDNLIDVYKRYFNLREVTFLRVDHEDAMVAIVYKIKQLTGEQFILKICPRSSDYLREVYFLKYFAGKLPVPNIKGLVEPGSGIHGAILMECLPGRLLKKADFTEAVAYETGCLLAHIHLNRAVEYGDLTQAENLSLDPRDHFGDKFEESLGECNDHLPEKLIKQCRYYYENHMNLLSFVDGPCLIHRDFRPGNVMVYKGNVKGIIDWASGRSSFAEEDFCPLEHGEWFNDSVKKKSFLAGYASVRSIPDYSDIMPLLRLNRVLATIGFTIKQGTWKNSYAHLYKINRQFLEGFFDRY